MTHESTPKIDTLLCCVMCRELIKINEHEQYVFGNDKDIVRVCNKCKEAINHMREEYEYQEHRLGVKYDSKGRYYK